MTDLIAAEFLKLRTTRTAWALLAATVAVSGLAVAGAVIGGARAADFDLESTRGVRTVLAVSASGAVFVLVLGIIISAGEYRQRTSSPSSPPQPRPASCSALYRAASPSRSQARSIVSRDTRFP